MHPEVAQMYSEPKFADPADTCFFLGDGTPHIACHECKVLHCTLHVSILFQSEICVGLCQFRAGNLAAAAAAFAVVVAADDATDNTHPGVLICCKWCR